MCIIDFIREFQILSAGVLALFAAILTAGLLYRGQWLLEKQHREKLAYDAAIESTRHKRQIAATLFALAPKLRHVHDLSQQHIGTIRTYTAAQAGPNPAVISTDEKNQLRLPEIPMADDWQALLEADQDMVQHARELSRQINMHNWKVGKTSSYIVEAVVTEYAKRLRDIRGHAHAIERYIYKIELPPLDVEDKALRE